MDKCGSRSALDKGGSRSVEGRAWLWRTSRDASGCRGMQAGVEGCWQRGAQARAVRQSAALNLGELARLSPRAGQLAEDLAVQAHSTVPPLQEAYLTALKGVLASAGERIAGPSLSLIGQELQAIASSAGDP